MKAKELLSLLEENLSDENVATAIAWLKTKKPTNKSANKVFSKVFFHSLVLTEAEWFKSRLKDVDGELLEYNLQELKNIEHFDFLIEFLNENVARPDAGYIWGGLLRCFRHRAIEPGAMKWLMNATPGSVAINSVLKELLRLNPDQNLVKIAKETLKQTFDLFLLVPLIEHRGDKDSYELGAKVIESDENPYLKEMVARAMVTSDLTANMKHINLFLSDERNKDAVRPFFTLLNGDEQIDFLEFACDWIAANRSTNLAAKRIKIPIFIEPSECNAARLWQWYIKGAQNDSRFEVMVRMFDNAWCPLNDEAKEYITDWTRKNAKHKLKKYAQSALDRTAKNAFKTIHGTYIYKDDFLEQGDSTSQNEKIDETTIDDWLENHHESRAQIEKALHGFHSTERAAEFSTLLNHLNHYQISLEVLLSSKSISMDKDGFLKLATKALDKGRLIKRWDYSAHTNIGNLIIESLRLNPASIKLLAHAKDWLAIKPEKHEMAVFEELTKLVKQH
ncbi:MAG: hypothetical protein C0507_06930 [Cyanobacteria bacterium PR.3.49]|nr:hypothetical protein [Cyanobacteria bacterium PR.3.49]